MSDSNSSKGGVTPLWVGGLLTAAAIAFLNAHRSPPPPGPGPISTAIGRGDDEPDLRPPAPPPYVPPPSGGDPQPDGGPMDLARIKAEYDNAYRRWLAAVGSADPAARQRAYDDYDYWTKKLDAARAAQR